MRSLLRRFARGTGHPTAERGTAILDPRESPPVDIFERNRAVLFDPKYRTLPPASRCYVICFEPRSGSTMLRSLLIQTGSSGFPSEFVNPRGVMQRYVTRSNAHDLTEYFGYLRHEFATPNGIFGMKASYPDFAPLIESGAVARLLHPVRFVHLIRQDVLRQAISAALARTTELWHARTGKEAVRADRRRDVDEALVLSTVDKLLLERMQWERFFALHGIEPFRMTYEALTADTRSTLRSLLRFLDIDVKDDAIPTVSETKQLSDAVNEEWLERIRARFPL